MVASRLRETFVRVANSNVHPTALPIEKLAERIDDKPGNLMLLPFFAGGGSVRNDPFAKGALIGLTFETALEDIVKALLEGVTYEQAAGLSNVPEIDEQVKIFRCGGGGVLPSGCGSRRTFFAGFQINTASTAKSSSCITAWRTNLRDQSNCHYQDIEIIRLSST